MKLFGILVIVELIGEFAVELLLNQFSPGNYFEVGFILRNWLLVVIYKLLSYAVVFTSIYYSFKVFLQTQVYYPFIYLISILATHFIIIYFVFKQPFFQLSYLTHPTYGVLDRLFFICISIFLCLLIFKFYSQLKPKNLP